MPDLGALRSAVRAAIVMPGVFAFADTIIGNPQTSLFAAFGSFSVLVLVEFGGRPRARLLAYALFAAAGAGLISIGTLCSRDAWLAAGATAIVGFVTLFAGAFSGYLAAATNGAILLFVLPANVPAPNSAIPDRLFGWGLAAGVGSAASLLLWPPRVRAELRRAAAGAIRSVIELIEAEGAERSDRSTAARASVDGLSRSFLGSQHRPSGPTAATAALAALPDELDWLLTFLAESPDQHALAPSSALDAESLDAAAGVLRASADRLEGGSAHADFERLDRAREEIARELSERLPELPASGDETVLPRALDVPFRIRAATWSARRLGIYAMRATNGNLPPDEESVPVSSAIDATEQLALEHVNPRSVWLQNSVRGAVALAVAVFIAQRSGLQHAFWIVLGTLSVLRSNALGTGWSIMSALAGTAVGLLIGAALVIGIGTHHAALWAALPLAVLLAAYAPRAISFAAGQAGFTVVLFVLFNLIQPVGWSVGVVRLEDVAIGFGISLGVGLLFWPRGASALLRSELATAFARSADYVVAATHELLGTGDRGETERAERAAETVHHRLDDLFRQYVAERTPTPAKVEDVAALVSAAERIHRAGDSLVWLSTIAPPATTLAECGRHLDGELEALHEWYIELGKAIVERRAIPPPHERDSAGRSALLDCARTAAGEREPVAAHAAVILLWSLQHLENLRRLEEHVRERAASSVAASPERRALLGLVHAS